MQEEEEEEGQGDEEAGADNGRGSFGIFIL
jgi:hypothetical protein